MENINYFNSNRNLAILLLIISSISISFGGLIMRNIHSADAWQITFYRSLAFTFSIALILSYKNRSSTLSTIKKVGYAGVMGGILLMGANLFFIQAFANTSIANTLFTLSLIPFITAVLAFIFLKEKLSLRTFTIMLVALFGILIMINEGIKTGDLFGNIMAIGCAFCFSSFTIVIRKFRNIDMIPTLLISGIIIAVVSFILNSGNLTIPSQDVLLCFLWGGLSGFVNSVFIYAARFLNASEVTFFMLLELSLGPFWVWLFLNETIALETLFGGIIVMSSVAVYSFIEIYISKITMRKNITLPT
ncbi:uncharacterized protein METZ01_LOCUS313253 [marine metagenome]|uniref:EamA domain-containing protein n=1 Tax=marine metagenome TaxID=408172 RepID=A0A382NGU3_9ZZZZ